MAAQVRVFTYSEVITAPVAASSGRYSSDSVGLLKNPYEGKDLVTPDTSTPQTTDAAIATNATRLAQVMVEPGKIVHYETIPSGQSRTVTTDSPYISGTVLLHFGPGWQLSFLEASF